MQRNGIMAITRIVMLNVTVSVLSFSEASFHEILLREELLRKGSQGSDQLHDNSKYKMANVYAMSTSYMAEMFSLVLEDNPS